MQRNAPALPAPSPGHRLPGWVTSVMNLGLTPGMRPRVVKRIRLTNVLAVSLMGLLVFYVPVFFALGIQRFLYLLPAQAVAFTVVLVLSGKRRDHLARLTFITSSTLLVVAFTALDRNGDIHLVLIGICTMPFILYEFEDRLRLLTAFAIPFSAFVAVSFFGRALLPEPVITCHPITIHFTLVLIVLITVLVLCREHDRAELSLYDSLARLEAETAARLQHERLASTEREKARIARAAGMAEIATGVLHNVGNILNSVNVSSCLLEERLRSSPAASLERAAALLRSGGASAPEKSAQLAQYLETFAAQLVRDREELAREVGGLRKNVEHIHSVVTTQQAFSRAVGVSENVMPRVVIEEALTLHAGSRERHRIGLVVEHEELPEVLIDRHKVLQILVNLVRNAVDALKVVSATNRRLKVRTAREGDLLVFEVGDNGVGISPDHLVRIFQHGFTTKDDGHGFGLHASSCLAVEMHGTLTCRSEGLGKGSTFRLALPLRLAGQGEPPRHPAA